MAKLGLRLRCDIRIELGPLSSNEPRLACKGLGIQIQRILLKSIAKPSEVKYPILMNLMYNQGVEQSSEIVDLGLKLGLIRNQEAACIYQGQSTGRNQQEAIHFLREHPELTRQIERDIRKSLHLFHNSV